VAPKVRVPCKTFGEVFRESGVQSIQLFSLDVEGAELDVLQTMDWTVPVQLWIIEQDKGDLYSRGTKDCQVRELLAQHGYNPTDWDLSAFCQIGHDCTSNVAYVRTP
jgi:hypothetical protein